MDLLAAFQTFVRVAETGSFSAVARQTNATQPAISRQIAALEEHLGARLIQRTTRSLALTEDGRDLLDHARHVLDVVEEAETAVGRRRTSPAGLVRMTVPVTFGRLYIAPRLPRLLQRYPELSLELTPADQQADLVAEGLDLAIRVGPVSDASLVARRIGSTRRVLMASREYLAEHGEPGRPEDLVDHQCVILLSSATPFDWTFDGPGGEVRVHVDGRFRTTSGEAAREGVLAGLGCAMLPSWFFPAEITDGRVRLLLPAWQTPTLALHAVYPSRRNLSSRTRAVIDFLVEEFRHDPVIAP